MTYDATAADRQPGADPPGWLAAAERRGVSPADALAAFDRLPPIRIDAMSGLWRGGGLHTGHPFDGLLEESGWYGKRFEDHESVFPLLFERSGGLVAIDLPALPLASAASLDGRLRRGAVSAFRLGIRLFATTRPTARLRELSFRGVTTAAMIYDRHPIIDVFREASPGIVLGLMDLRGVAPMFFTLRRAATSIADATTSH